MKKEKIYFETLEDVLNAFGDENIDVISNAYGYSSFNGDNKFSADYIRLVTENLNKKRYYYIKTTKEPFTFEDFKELYYKGAHLKSVGKKIDSKMIAIDTEDNVTSILRNDGEFNKVCEIDELLESFEYYTYNGEDYFKFEK